MAFKKGESGNPKGRPVGCTSSFASRNLGPIKGKFTEYAIKNFDNWAHESIEKTFELAKKGHERILLMLWDRFFCPSTLDLVLKSKTVEDISESQSLVIDKMCRSEITREEAMDLIRTLSQRRETILVEDLERKIKEIQENLKT